MSLLTENEPGYEGELFAIEGDADNEISKKKSKEQPPEAIYKKKLIPGQWDDFTRIVNEEVKKLQKQNNEVTWSLIPDGTQTKVLDSILDELKKKGFPEAEEREKAVVNILGQRLRKRKYDENTRKKNKDAQKENAQQKEEEKAQKEDTRSKAAHKTRLPWDPVRDAVENLPSNER